MKEVNNDKIQVRAEPYSPKKGKKGKKKQEIEITIDSISAFDVAPKGQNDKKNNDLKNKVREKIISMASNRTVPPHYLLDEKWKKLNDALTDGYLEQYISDQEDIKCEILAGRGNHSDFNINGQKVEFKFNASKVSQLPEFISLTRPSNYTLGTAYEAYYYDEYLWKLAEYANLPLPDRETYLKEINNNKPACMQPFVELYKSDDIFKALANKCSSESIANYIQTHELNKEKLYEELCETQKDKIYMLYKNGVFYYEKPIIEEYDFSCYQKHNHSYIFKHKTETKKYISVMLRWKNRNGIAFPAYQIKYHNPVKMPKYIL